MSENKTPRLARLQGISVKKEDENTDRYSIVLEDGAGTLRRVVKHLAATKDVREKEFWLYAKECCECLRALHERNNIHGDIRPENFILVCISQNTLKLKILGVCEFNINFKRTCKY